MAASVWFSGLKLASALHLAGNLSHNVLFMPAINPETGTLFTVTAVLDPGTKMVVARSSDGGASWSVPKAIDYPGATNQLLPTPAFHHGTLSVIWYDTRHNPGFMPASAFAKMDGYYAELDNDLQVRRVERIMKTSQFVNINCFSSENGNKVKTHDSSGS